MAQYNQEIYDTALRHEKNDHRAYGLGAGHVDCSHFVQQILEEATRSTFHYIQANDYAHSPHFMKVDQPDRGDIVFWHETPHGHVGIVMDPHQHTFLGSQSTHGVGVQRYNSSYWRAHGGGPRFLRFVG